MDTNDPQTAKIRYVYDALNQLVWEKNETAGKAWQYTYDLGGNILTKTEYDYANGQTSNPVTVSYVYGDAEWHDLLTSYNNQTITYDGMGNPLSYRGWTMTWQGGRQLAGMTNGTDTLSFGYNEGGLRTAKTVGNTTRSYVWNSSQLLVDRGVDDTLYFHYNANGEMIGYTRKTASGETECFLVKNQQGDVEKVIAADGTVLAAYTYDAWGNILSATGSLANANPIRYRGYYFDSETGLYYVSSRYYDPEICRWINADDSSCLGANGDFASVNLFAYCGNNPVIRADDGGDFWNTIIGAFAGAVVGGITAAIAGTDIKAGMVSGAINGAITGAAVDIAIATGGAGVVVLAAVTVAGGVGGATSSYVNQRMNGVAHEDVDWASVAVDGAWGAVGAALTFGVADVGGPEAQPVKEILKQSGRKILKQAGEDFLMSTVISAGTLLNAEKMKYISRSTIYAK